MMRVFRHYAPTIVLGLIVADLATTLGAIALSSQLGPWIGEGPIWPKAVMLSAFILFSLYLADLYDPTLRPGRRELLARLLFALLSSAVFAAAAGFALPSLRFGRLAFLDTLGLLVVGLSLERMLFLEVRSTQRQKKRLIVLGVSRAAELIVQLQNKGAESFSIVGFLDDDPGAPDRLPPGYQLLGKTKDFLTIVDELQPDLVVVALPDMRGTLPTRELFECRLRGIRVEDWPTFFEKQTGKILVTDLRLSWLVFSDGFAQTHLTQTLKRVLDVTLALIGLVLASPLMILIAILIKLSSPGPVMFRQARVGHHGRLFVLNKFRSMIMNAEQQSGPVWASLTDPRVTRVGPFLRKTRLDELPQLFNVLAGDMSFIGPRPERPEFVQTLQQRIPFYMERLSVKPGITGWAQVCYQYGASVEDALEKLQYDLYYIKNLSLFLDFVILLSTVQVVLFAKGSR